ncbi:MAG: hemolysin III family protein [Actinomycetes bacterium]
MRGWLHLFGLVASLIAGPILIAQAHNATQALGLSIYTLSLVVLFGTSSTFHRVKWKPRARRIMRRLDHSAIFILIAGTYTGVAMVSLQGWALYLVLGLAWGGTVVGIVVRQVFIDAPKWVNAIPYVVVGWSALAVMGPLITALGGWGFALLLLGGLAYTAGALVYALKRPDPFPRVFGYHEVFHALTLVGAGLHYVVIASFALPRSS